MFRQGRTFFRLNLHNLCCWCRRHEILEACAFKFLVLQADQGTYSTVLGCLLNGAQTAQFKQQGLFFDTMLYTHIFSESFFCFPVT